MNMTHSQFPIGPNRYIKDYDIVTTIGAFYYMITPLFAFLFIQSEIVREKEYKLRQGSFWSMKRVEYFWSQSWCLLDLVVCCCCHLFGCWVNCDFACRTYLWVWILHWYQRWVHPFSLVYSIHPCHANVLVFPLYFGTHSQSRQCCKLRYCAFCYRRWKLRLRQQPSQVFIRHRSLSTRRIPSSIPPLLPSF